MRIAILTNIIPTYRRGFYQRLITDESIDFKVFCQDSIKGVNVKSIHQEFISNVTLIKTWAISGEKLVWQRLPYFELFRNYDIIVVDGNPRIVSQALFATLAKFLGKKIVIWSMAHSSHNNSFSENIRLFWWRYFDYFLMYNELDIVKLKQSGIKGLIMLAINNGLDQRDIDNNILKWPDEKLENWQKTQQIKGKIVLLSSGRLTQNKFLDMFYALPKLLEHNPNIHWCIIGEGIGKKNLETLAENLNILKNITFIGELYDEEQLAPWFLSATIFVHPAAIGLSILHSFGYGLPIITYNNSLFHGPEFVVFEEGKTGLLYTKNDPNDLSEKILKLLLETGRIKEMNTYVKKIAQYKYNVDLMKENFIKMISSIDSEL